MAILKQKIVPHLWFDKEAEEAAEFYASVFPDSRVTNITTLHDTPGGKASCNRWSRATVVARNRPLGQG